MWVDDPHLNLDYHVRQHGAARARLRRAAAQPGGADLLPAAGPHQAALGAVAGRGARRRPLRDRRQEPPLPRRRRLRGRHNHRPLRPRPRAEATRRRAPPWARAARADRSAAARPGGARTADGPGGDRPRLPRRAARAAQDAARRSARPKIDRRRDSRPRDRLQRRDRAAPPLRRSSRPTSPSSGGSRTPTAAPSTTSSSRWSRGRSAGICAHSATHRGAGAQGDGAGQRPRRRRARGARQPDLGDDGAAPGLVRGPGRAAAG